MTQGKTTRPYCLVAVVLGLLSGGMLFFSAWLEQGTATSLPAWFNDLLCGVGILTILAYGFHLYRKQPGLSKGWLVAATFLALLFNGASLAYAAYTGPNRTTTTTSWDRQECSYHATYSTYGCSLNLYDTTGSCYSTGSTAGYFNPTACAGWPGTCGAGLPCSISQTGNSTVGCSAGDAFCTSHTTTSSLPAATVSGSTACADPGSAGWCRGGARLSLTGNDPVSGWTITAIESDLFGNLCTGGAATLNCVWIFPEGSTSMNYWADSSNGDSSYASSAAMNVDSVAPAISIFVSGTAGANGWYTAPVHFSGNASDASPSSGIAATQYVLDGGVPHSGSAFTVSTDGTHTAYFTTQDIAGNASAPSATDTVQIDQVPPSVSASVSSGTAGGGGWYTSPVQLTGSASDATSGLDATGLVSSLDGGAPQPGSTANVSGDGTHTLVVSAHDMAGNLGSFTNTVKIDTTAPTAGFSVPAADGSHGWHTTAFVVTPNSSDATSGVATTQVSLDGSTWSSSVSISTDGVYTIYSTATDNAGNVSPMSTQTVRLDTTAPSEVLVLPPTATGWYTGQPAITVNASDATSGVATVRYSADGSPFAATLPILADGTHTIQAQVTDLAGNTSTSAIAVIHVDATQPQSLFVSPAEGSTVVAVGNFSMTGETTDATSGVAGAQISFDNGASWAPLTVTAGSWSYAWDTGNFANGTYNILVSGLDNAGNQEHTAHVSVVVANQGPEVAITPSWVIWQKAAVKITEHVLPVTGAHISIATLGGAEIQHFDYTGSNLPSSFKWNGLTSKGKSAPFGLYSVRVEIWDGYGHHATSSGTVWIPAPQATETPTPLPTTTPTATILALPTQTAAVVVAQPTPTPETIIPISGSKPDEQLAFSPIDPIFLWPALALLAFLAILSSSAFSDQRHKAYNNLGQTIETLMRQEAALRSLPKGNLQITDQDKKGN